MLYLLLTVACSVLLGFIFKLFARFGVDGFQAIIFNYLTCFCCGWIHLGQFPVQEDHFTSAWMPYALILGLVFISGFNLAAMTVRYFGVTVGQIMQKMSILITVPFAILVYGESSGWMKLAGFVCALASIVLVNWPKAEQPLSQQKDIPKIRQEINFSVGLWIPAGTWILAGLLEVMLVVVQKNSYADMQDPTFIVTVFGTAGVLGLILALSGWATRRLKFDWKNVWAGILLGIPNYGSMLFMLFALSGGLEGSFVFPVVNVAIIVLTTIGAVTLFRERLSPLNWIGIGLAVSAIALITA